MFFNAFPATKLLPLANGSPRAELAQREAADTVNFELNSTLVP
jgi:hypothetical protein